MGVSAPSLHRESTDSLITRTVHTVMLYVILILRAQKYPVPNVMSYVILILRAQNVYTHFSVGSLPARQMLSISTSIDYLLDI